MKRRECLKLIGGAAAATWVRPGFGEEPEAEPAKPPQFGASAITLGAPGRRERSRDSQFSSRRRVSAGYPDASEDYGGTTNRLYVEFLNAEPDPRYRGNPGTSQTGSILRATIAFSCPPILTRSMCRFARLDERRSASFAADSSGAREGDGFDVKVERQSDAWTAHFEIPWERIGGRPDQSPFGLNLVRSRGQSSEILSPAALDQTLTLPADLMMVATFGEAPRYATIAGFLIELADGTLRWQLPAKLAWPDGEERRALWEDQQTLSHATARADLPKRIELAQRLHDTLVLEGFQLPYRWVELAGRFGRILSSRSKNCGESRPLSPRFRRRLPRSRYLYSSTRPCIEAMVRRRVPWQRSHAGMGSGRDEGLCA